MNTYPSDEYLSDDGLFQDMEEQLYNPLPDGFVERDWLDLPEMEQSWFDLPQIERNWLDLPEVEQNWLDTPTAIEHDHVEQTLDGTLDFDRDI